MITKKGTDLHILKKIIESSNQYTQDDIKEALGEILYDIYSKAMPISKIDIMIISEIYSVIARMMFPGSIKPVYEMFLLVAKETYNTLYSVFVRVASLNFILGKGQMIWGKYYEVGQAHAAPLSENSFEFVVEGFHELTPELIQVARAHVAILTEKCGKKLIDVKVDDSDKNKIRWISNYIN